MSDPFDLLLNRGEAHSKAASEKDAFTRAFMKQALHTAHRIVIPGDGGIAIQPTAPFDVSFLVEVARAMAESREAIQRFLNGDLVDDFGDPL
jgi:hypothetical protein